MKHRWRLLSGVLCAAMFCTACQTNDTEKVQIGKYEEQEHQAKLDALEPSAYGSVSNLRLEPGTYISVIGKSDSGDFWKSVEKGAKQAAEDINKMMGYKGEDKVKVVYSGSAGGEDVDQQVNILDEELSRNPAAIGISIIDADMSEVQFDLVSDNEIPIVMYDSGKEYQGVVSMIGTNNREAGKTAGNKLGDAVNNSGKVALFMKDSKSTSSKVREAGICEALKEGYPEVEIVDIYHGDELEERSKEAAKKESQETEKATAAAAKEGTSGTEAAKDTEDLKETAAPEADKAENTEAETALAEEEPMTDLEMVKYILEANPDLAGCVAGNEEMTKLLVQAKEELKLDDLKLIGFDGGETLVKALEDGKVDGLIIQNPFGMGYATVVAAARAILSEANEAVVDSGYIWVTEENLGDESIQKMLY